MSETVNLSVDFLGLKLRTPLAVTEGPLSRDGQTIRWALEHQVGIVFTKGVRPEPAVSPSPYIGQCNRSLMNADWSDIGFAQWLKEIRALPPGTPFAASIAKNYVTPEVAADMAVELQAAGAPIISMCDYVPEQLIAAVKAARPRIKVPLMYKLPPFLPNLEAVLKELVAAGIDAIAAMDSIGPVMEVDINTGLPSMGSPDGSGYLSGTAIRPVTVKYIYEIARLVNLPVVAVGGVTTARDVVEMTMVGATCVGMVAAPLLRGLDVFDQTADTLRELLPHIGVNDINAVRRKTQRLLEGHSMVFGLHSSIAYDKCTYCKQCSKVCFVRAIRDDGKRVVADKAVCVGCGLCASICPSKAISLVRD